MFANASMIDEVVVVADLAIWTGTTIRTYEYFFCPGIELGTLSAAVNHLSITPTVTSVFVLYKNKLFFFTKAIHNNRHIINMFVMGVGGSKRNKTDIVTVRKLLSYYFKITKIYWVSNNNLYLPNDRYIILQEEMYSRTVNNS